MQVFKNSITVVGRNMVLSAVLAAKIGSRISKEFIRPIPRANISGIENFIEDYRKHGVHYSTLDPLDLQWKETKYPTPSDYNLTKTTVLTQKLSDQYPFIKSNQIETIIDLEKKLKSLYTDKVGVEFEQVLTTEEKSWLYTRFDELMSEPISNNEKYFINDILIKSETFDHFLQQNKPEFKRYSIEGGESMLILLAKVFGTLSEKGVDEVVLSSAHRGRLNILCQLLEYPIQDLFQKMTKQSELTEDLNTFIDDIIMHVAVCNKNTFKTKLNSKEKELKIQMLHNPSFLEIAASVANGKTKAKQDDFGDVKSRVASVQLHGDAAFAAQGVAYEIESFSKHENFNVGGSINIIVNNQLGFTTGDVFSRSSKFSSDLAKIYGYPVIHVNADHPEIVYKIGQLAAEYRQKFQKSFYIDLVGYRRYGHNELDEPSFTSPVMYSKIRNEQVTCPQQYISKLINEQILPKSADIELRKEYKTFLESELKKGNNKPVKQVKDLKKKGCKGSTAFRGKWGKMGPSQYGVDMQKVKTGITKKRMEEYKKVITDYPKQDFTLHSRLGRFHFEDRLKQFKAEKIDWATAEALAFTSLIDEGNNIRISGQEVPRGTFSQRHLLVRDQKTGKKFNPIQNYSEENKKRGKFSLVSSNLSEEGVLAFEYGYSLENPKTLPIWEAQFGDFYTTAQSVIDSFILSSEDKWMRQSGLTMLLPHGMDGMAMEHSTCRMERWLQQGSTDGHNPNLSLKSYDSKRSYLQPQNQYFYENHQDINFFFLNLTTPANYFHALRRQLMINYRKPLIIASPKISKTKFYIINIQSFERRNGKIKFNLI